MSNFEQLSNDYNNIVAGLYHLAQQHKLTEELLMLGVTACQNILRASVKKDANPQLVQVMLEDCANTLRTKLEAVQKGN